MGLDDVSDHLETEADGGEIFYERFSKRVCSAIGYYVYRLVDPRNDETFYVGRGVNNRCFDHMEEAEDALFGGRSSKKTDRINAIHKDGLKVETIMHRHALRDDEECGTVEAAMIEAYPDLTNKVAGEGTTLYGARPTSKVIRQYDLPPAAFGRHKCLLLSLTKRWPRADDDAPTSWFDIYARARHGWPIDIKRAEKADYVVAHARGIIVAVFEVDEWLASSDPVFSVFPAPERTPAWGFVGGPAGWLAREAWLGRRVPNKHREKFGRKVEYVNL